MAMTKLKIIMKSPGVKSDTKINIFEKLIFLMVTYGSYCWVVRKRKIIHALELRTWRRMLRVLWTERRTKTSVLEEVKRKRSLETTILRLNLRYFGHFMRARGKLEGDIMLGHVAGYRRQGKPQMHWLDSTQEAAGLRLEDLKEVVLDRKKWCILVEESTSPPDGGEVYPIQN
jgi:hypothetical protein